MRLDDQRESDNVEDMRGASGGFGGFGGRSLGIGGVIVALVASYFLGVDPSVLLGMLSGDSGGPVIDAAGITGLFSCVVTSDDVLQGKPHPEGYLVALGLLRGSVADLQPGQVAVIEDTEAGLLAAKAAGMYCLGLLGTMTADRLSAADELVETIDLALVERLLN
jgi:beta-phosphoglucomutase-like phosphatase (HAD superfamily)